ncbi:MAG TPA: serine hydrolase domain-containing protein [Gemmatimonadales bacterium]|nr:serine hydrolase domain-containing protein [Gemmatimonadales bacterium]
MKRGLEITLAAVLAAASTAAGGATPAMAQRQAPRPAAAEAGWPAFVQAFDAYARADSVVGGAAVLVRNGRVVARHDWGWADRDARQRADTGTIYHYGSITKTLTAIAVMQLRDRGRLSLDDRVVRWVPELRQVHDPYGAIDSVTVRMLLSHTAGFQNPTWPYGDGQPWEPFEPTRWEQLVAMMPYQTLHFRPGTRYSYSNPAYVYLARIVEQITGDPWETYVQKNLLTPLGLTRSYFGATPYHLAAERSNNYTLVRDSTGDRAGERVVANGRDFDPGVTIPNSGWNAPLGDLVRYAAFLTRAPHDTATGRRWDTVLPRRTLEEMWRPVAAVTSYPNAGAVGLGFFSYTAPTARGDSVALVGHTGEQAGFRSALYLNPRTGTAVIYVLNTTDEAHAERSSAGWLALLQQALRLLP